MLSPVLLNPQFLTLQASRSATPSGRTSPGEEATVTSGEDKAAKSVEVVSASETKAAEPANVTDSENVAVSQQDSPVAVKREIKTEQEEEGDEGADVFSQATAGEDEEGEEEVEDESKVKAALQTGLLGKGIAEEERRMAAESKRSIWLLHLNEIFIFKFFTCDIGWLCKKRLERSRSWLRRLRRCRPNRFS